MGNNEEYLDIIDEDNNLTGEKRTYQEVHTYGLLHREVAVWVINEKGELLLQKRSPNKSRRPNEWAICAGHVDSRRICRRWNDKRII